MAGTLSEASIQTLCGVFREYSNGEAWEMVDVGAGSGIVLAVAFCYGASQAVGVEVMDGMRSVFHSFQKILVQHDVPKQFSAVHYGQDIMKCTQLPALALPSLPKVVFSFCDGFNPPDRLHMFGLIGRDALVRVFVCSPGNATGDGYRKPMKILSEINKASEEMSLPLFVYDRKLKVNMHVGQSVKYLFSFKRIIDSLYFQDGKGAEALAAIEGRAVVPPSPGPGDRLRRSTMGQLPKKFLSNP
jgi:hypothetical protein